MLALLIGGALAGLAGAFEVAGVTGRLYQGISAGTGYTAIAVALLARLSPLAVVLAALFFGATTALQFRLQARGAAIPYPVFLMLPYVVTLGVLAFATGRAAAPGDLGRAYEREAP